MESGEKLKATLLNYLIDFSTCHCAILFKVAPSPPKKKKISTNHVSYFIRKENFNQINYIIYFSLVYGSLYIVV
jgi:acyl-CoA thioesterase